MSRWRTTLEFGALTRRGFVKLVAASAVAATEAGRLSEAAAEEKFTIASTGGSWGEGIRESFVTGTNFEKRFDVSVAYSHQLESVAASKVLANCGKPVFSVTANAQAEAMLMADGGCLAGYDTGLVTNYKAIYPVLRLEQNPGIGPYYAPFLFLVWGLAWNSKHAKKPTSYKDLWKPEYEGRIGVPAYGWYGIYWLHAVNKMLGGNEDNITPGMQAIADLVKKNNAVIVENVDHGNKLFEREEIVMAPFWNGRTFALQDKGVPVGFEFVPYSIALGNGFVVVKGTSFPELAQRFVNLTLDGENQMGMVRRFKYPPSSRNVKLPAEFERIEVTEGQLEQSARLDWKKINDHRGAYLERWNKEVLG